MKNYLKTGKGIATVGIAVVFAIAVYISGKHIFHVALHYGQSLDTALALPAIVDIFALFCAIKLRSTGSKIQKYLNRAGMWTMLAFSLGCNIESALITNSTLAGLELSKAIVLSAWPAIVVAWAAEILTHIRSSSSKPATKTTPVKAPSKATEPRKATTPTRSRAKTSIKSTDLSEPLTA